MKRLAFCSFFIRSISEGWLFVLLTTAQACGALACCHCVARTTCSRGWQNARRAQSCHRGRPSYLQATGQPRAAGSKTLQAPAASTGLAQGRQARWLWLRRVCCEAAAPQVYTTPQCSPAVHRLAETARVTLSLLRWRRQSTSLPEFPEQPLPLGLARHKERGTSQPLPTKAAAQTAARHPLAPLLREHQVHFPFCVRCAHTWAAANPRARRWLGYQVQACAAAAPRTGGPRGCACSVVVILAARVAAVAAAGIAVVVPVAPAAAAAAAAAACAVAAAAAAPAAAKVTTAAALVRPWRY